MARLEAAGLSIGDGYGLADSLEAPTMKTVLLRILVRVGEIRGEVSLWRVGVAVSPAEGG